MNAMAATVEPNSTVAEPKVNLPGSDYEYREFCSLAGVALTFSSLAALTLVLISVFNPVIFAVLPVLGTLFGVRAFWKIRTSDGELSGTKTACAAIMLGLSSLSGGWGYMAYEYATEVPEGFERISYAQLEFDYLKQREIPEEILALNGKPVFIKGYVYPGNQMVGIQKFVLCRDSGDCCFGGEPPLTDMIQVELDESESMEYSQFQTKVWGTFRIEARPALHELGHAIYHLEDAGYAR